MAGRKDIEAGRAYVSLYVKDSALAKGLQAAGRKLQDFGAKMARIGTMASLAGTAMAIPLAFAVKNFADFDDAMRAVKGVTQATVEQWQVLTKTAKDLGASTSFTAVQVASLMVELGRAGFKPEEIAAMTGAVLNLARATGTDATLASGILAASIRQFSLGAAEATRVADVLTATANKTFNTVESLGEAFTYAGPVAADFGMTIEETAAVLGALGNVGIQGSNAGTALRRMMIITGAEAEKLKGIFGVSFRDAAGNARPLVDVFEEINNSTASLGTGERAEKFNEAFGLLGITGASVMGRNVGSVRELQEALKGASGTAAKTAAEMDAGLGGALRILLSAVEGVKISFGSALSPVLISIGETLTLASGWLRDFIDANQGVVIAVAAAVATLLIGGVALTGFGFAAIGIGAALTTVGAIIGAVLSPVGMLISVIAAATAAFITFTDTGSWLADTLMGDFGVAFDTVKQTIGGISDALAAGDIALAAEIAMVGLKAAFFEATNTIRTVWIDFNKGLVEGLANASKAVLDIWRKTSQTLSEWFADLGYKTTLFMTGQKDYLTDDESNQVRNSALNNYYDTVQGSMEGGIDSLAQGLTEDLDAQLKAGEDRIQALKDELAALRGTATEKATVARAARDAAPEATKPGDAKVAMGAGMSAPSTSAATFSSAALAALGQGGGPMDKLVKVNEDQKKIAERQLKAADEATASLRKMEALLTVS